MDDTLVYHTDISEIRIGKMQFVILNRRPLYIQNEQEKAKATIERQLFQVFQKYA